MYVLCVFEEEEEPRSKSNQRNHLWPKRILLFWADFLAVDHHAIRDNNPRMSLWRALSFRFNDDPITMFRIITIKHGFVHRSSSSRIRAMLPGILNEKEVFCTLNYLY